MTTYNFVPKRNRKYGWLPDRPDKRDKLYAAVQPTITLPEEVTLRRLCSDVEDQGKLSSCVGNACAAMLECLENKEAALVTITQKLTPWQKFMCSTGFRTKGCSGTQYVGFQDVSRLFIYYNARARDGMERSDRGAYIRSALKSLNTQGYCWEKDWVYDWGKVNARPPQACYSDAQNRKVVDYFSLVTINEMMTCLADGFPFVIGLSIFEGFESDDVKRSGIVNMPKQSEGSLGGHAVCCVGYNKKTSRFLMKNSWGPMWGDGGYFTIPFDYVAGYGGDIWTIRK